MCSRNLASPLGMGGRKRVGAERRVVAREQVVDHSAELGLESWRENGHAHDLDEADVLLLDMPEPLVRVEDAERVLRRGDVASEREIEHERVAVMVADRRHRVVAHAVRLGEDAHRGVGPTPPRVEHVGRRVDELVGVLRAQAYDRERPTNHAGLHAGMARQGEPLDDLGAHHREAVAPALEVVVAQDGAAHDGQVGIRTHEVVGEALHELQETRHVLAVHVHRPVNLAHDDAVLAEVRVGAVLEAPGLAAERDGNDAQILAGGMRAVRTRCGTPRVSLVLDAELAGRISLADARAPRGGDVTGVLLGL